MLQDFLSRIEENALQYRKYALRTEKIFLILLALSVCISEPLSRNINRIIFVMFAVKFFITKNPIMELIKRYKNFLLTISAFAWWMIISSLYGGHLVKDNDSNVYWFFFSHNMILFIPLIAMIRRQKNSEKLLIATGISLCLDNLFMAYQIFEGAINPTTFLNDSPFQSSILYVLMLPTFLILTFNADGFKRRIFYTATFFTSLIVFLFLHTVYAQIVTAIIFLLILGNEFFSGKKIPSVITALIISLIMSQGALKDVPNFEDAYPAREIVWQTSLEMLKDNPIMGVGLGNYQNVFVTYNDNTENFKLSHAYNSYLQFWSETGIFGLMLFCGIFGGILIWSKKRCGNVYGQILFFSTLSLMLYSFTDFIFESYSALRLYWVLFGICLASLDR